MERVLQQIEEDQAAAQLQATESVPFSGTGKESRHIEKAHAKHRFGLADVDHSVKTYTTHERNLYRRVKAWSANTGDLDSEGVAEEATAIKELVRVARTAATTVVFGEMKERVAEKAAAFKQASQELRDARKVSKEQTMGELKAIDTALANEILGHPSLAEYGKDPSHTSIGSIITLVPRGPKDGKNKKKKNRKAKKPVPAAPTGCPCGKCIHKEKCNLCSPEGCKCKCSGCKK